MGIENLKRGLTKLKTRGGKGQAGIGIIGGSCLTIRETAVTTLAKDIVDDVIRRTNKPFAEIPLIEFRKDVVVRSEGRLFTAGEVFAEIGRMQNHELCV